MEHQETYSAMNSQTEMKMAGFGPRWGALLVDVNVLVLIILFFFRSFVPLLRGSNFDASELSDSFKVGGVLMYLFGLPIIGILYQAIFECSRLQGTPGKIAVKIKVVNMHGEKVSFLQAVGRNAGKILSSLIIYIGFLMAIWTDKKQTLHDQMANTYVVLRR